jgi:hypothetical protein
LEAVTRLGLRKLAKVLREPLDPTDASRTRNQITAAGIAVNAQLRADEQRLRAKVGSDVLERLLERIEAERRKQERDEARELGAGARGAALGEAAAERLPRADRDEDMPQSEKSSDEAS